LKAEPKEYEDPPEETSEEEAQEMLEVTEGSEIEEDLFEEVLQEHPDGSE